ncbi:MAG: hypothetical protein HN509_02085 [Halobacteriovoraceae bacterium]|jgi:hypothetical protein|nr:hypothetical protein [Halobacteriovoraceae bacterium]MBT5093875.1 hypothetical protein [Halobacteriovoraceae bacterium]
MQKVTKLLIIFSFISSCATPPGLTKKVNEGTKQQHAAALKNTKSQDPKKNVVYFFNTNEMPGVNYAFSVFVDGKIIAKVNEGTYTRVELPIGKHKIQLSFYDEPPNYRKHFWQVHNYKNGVVNATIPRQTRMMTIPSSRRGPMIIKFEVMSSWKGSEVDHFYFFQGAEYGEPAVTKLLSDADYVIPRDVSFNMEYASSGERGEWDLYANSNSTHSLANFIRNNSRNPFIEQAKTRKSKLLKKELAAFSGYRKTDTLKSYSEYMTLFPEAHNRYSVYSRMSKRIKKKGTYSRFFKKHPGIIKHYPAGIRMGFELMAIGPSGMKIGDVLSYSKEGLGTDSLSAKIKATNAPYRDFSIPEIKYLKKRGINGRLIAAMIEANTEHVKQLKEANKNQKMMSQIQELIKKSQVQAVSNAAAAGASGGNKNMAVECIKLKAALKACSQTGGLIAMVCKSTARSSFSCNVDL